MDGANSQRLLDDLDEAQRAAVTCEQVPLAIIAGPGSGKTRVLTRRIAWRIGTGQAEASRVLAVTFTRKAAAELTSRLGALGVIDDRGVSAGTLHSIALAQLRRRAAGRDRTMPGLLERKARLLVPLVAGTGRRGPDTVATAADVAGEIEWAKARLITADGYPAAATRLGRTPALGVDAVAALYARYEREKRRARLVDFDDLLWWCGDALETDPDFAAEQRWRFRHLFVDEFQDVSPAQLRLLRGWLGDRADLTVVGDPDQAIFSFTGADPTALTDFRRVFPGAHVVRLERNYRSTPQVLHAAEALLADGGRRRRPQHAVRRDGPVTTVTDYDSEADEAAGVAARIRDARRPGRPWSDFAVLYRTNAQSAVFEEAFTTAGIPYRVRGDDRFLDRPAVRALLERLCEADAAAPGMPLTAHLTDLGLDLDTDTDDAAGDEERSRSADERRQHTAAIVRLGREYATIDPNGSVDGFLAWLRTALRNEDAPIDGDAVELLTFHRAKGLEFHTVYVTGLERGLVPIARADEPAARAEERRLLYVALTRAEQALHLTWARRRTLGSRECARMPSPWLEPIEAAARSPDPSATAACAPSPDRVRDELERARGRVARASSGDRYDGSPDPELLAALVEWRRTCARAAAVPADVILPDTTLRAIATLRPTRPNALLEVGGIGPVKAARYGEAVLEIVRRHTDGPALASA